MCIFWAKMNKNVRFLNHFLHPFFRDDRSNTQGVVGHRGHEGGGEIRSTKSAISSNADTHTSDRRDQNGKFKSRLLGCAQDKADKSGLRAYPNNPLYCGRLQSPMPALSAKNVLNVEKTHLRAFLACRLGLELFARPHNDPVIRISSKYKI